MGQHQVIQIPQAMSVSTKEVIQGIINILTMRFLLILVTKKVNIGETTQGDINDIRDHGARILAPQILLATRRTVAAPWGGHQMMTLKMLAKGQGKRKAATALAITNTNIATVTMRRRIKTFGWN